MTGSYNVAAAFAAWRGATAAVVIKLSRRLEGRAVRRPENLAGDYLSKPFLKRWFCFFFYQNQRGGGSPPRPGSDGPSTNPSRPLRAFSAKCYLYYIAVCYKCDAR